MALAWLLWALQESAPRLDPPRVPSWDDFPVFVWREKYAGKPLPDELVAPFGGVILMRDEDSSWARERGLAYLVWNVAGRNALHLDADEAWQKRVERWIQTHDEKLLVREPCLNDPRTIAELHATLETTLKKHGEHPGLGFVLGDEVSLTPNGDPFDLCRCGFCEAKWKEYAQERGLPERAPLTDEVLAGLRGNDFSRLGAWMARRRFDQDRIVEVIEELSASSSMSPSSVFGDVAYAGLLGCKGQTAFGGVALERVVECLGLIECYPLDSARELAATAPGLWRHALDFSTGPDPGPRARLTTIFLHDADPAELAWNVYDSWLHGASGLVLWNDAELARLPSEARARLIEAVATVRSSTFPQEDGAPTALRFWPGDGRIAVVRDADSTALSFLRDAHGDGATWPRRKASYQHEHGTLERKVEGWMRLIEDCQLEPAAIALGAVCANCWAHGLTVLVLPEVLVLGDDDVARLAAYVAGGGWLVVDGTLGWVDRGGRLRDDRDLRARLGGEHPERVVDAPGALGDYLETRLDQERSDAPRRFLLGLRPVKFEREYKDTPVRPTFSGEAARVPWLVQPSEVVQSRPGYTLLPNYESVPELRPHLRDIPLDGVCAPEGYTLEWILPSDGKILRAGDAARLRLRPKAR